MPPAGPWYSTAMAEALPPALFPPSCITSPETRQCYRHPAFVGMRIVIAPPACGLRADDEPTVAFASAGYRVDTLAVQTVSLNGQELGELPCTRIEHRTPVCTPTSCPISTDVIPAPEGVQALVCCEPR